MKQSFREKKYSLTSFLKLCFFFFLYCLTRFNLAGVYWTNYQNTTKADINKYSLKFPSDYKIVYEAYKCTEVKVIYVRLLNAND